MMRRVFLKFALAAAALALAAPAYAGGVAVEFDSPVAGAEAGVAFSFGFTIRSAHEDRTLMEGLTPLIRASNPATDQQVETTAKAEGARGHYVATIAFPSAGAWRWQIHPFGNQDANYFLTLPGPLQVRAKGARPAAARAAASNLVDAKGLDSAFDPRELTVAAGTTVRWNMGGKFPHTVTAVDGSFTSGNVAVGKSYEFTFAEPGTYAYYCEYHGTANGQGMYGKVVVTAAEAAPAPAALPRTGGADLLPLAALLAGLLAVGGGAALWWRRRWLAN
jgi:plastocyanin